MRDLCYSEILCSIDLYVLTDVSGRPVGSIFKGQGIQKRENSMIEVNCHNLLFLGVCALFDFLKKHYILEVNSVSILGKDAPNLVDLLD